MSGRGIQESSPYIKHIYINYALPEPIIRYQPGALTKHVRITSDGAAQEQERESSCEVC